MSDKAETMSDAAVRKATGYDWAEWRLLLDRAGAKDWSHKEIVSFLSTAQEVDPLSGWWQQTVAVGYEKMIGRRVVGQTADAGYQVGVQRTLPLSLAATWRFLVSDDAVRDWLGGGVDTELAAGVRYATEDGISGEIRVVKPGDRIRLTRQEGTGASSTLQIALTPSGDRKTSVRFHHEKLTSTADRERMRQSWTEVLDSWVAASAASEKTG